MTDQEPITKTYKNLTLEQLQTLYKDKITTYDLWWGFHQAEQNRVRQRNKYHSNRKSKFEQLLEDFNELKNSSSPPLNPPPPPPPPPPTSPDTTSCQSNSEPPKPTIIKDTKVKKLIQ